MGLLRWLLRLRREEQERADALVAATIWSMRHTAVEEPPEPQDDPEHAR